MLHDQHVHSMYSRDSNELLENYIKKAKENNLKYFITTEHIEFDSVITNDNWEVDYPNLIKELNELGEKYKINVLLGVEIGFRLDKLDLMNDLVNKYDFDLINMSIHDSGKFDYYMEDHFKEYGLDFMMNIYLDNCISGLNNFFNYDVFSHFDYAFKTIYKLDNNFDFTKYEEKIIEVLKLIIKNNKALEVNTKVQSAFKDDSHLIYLLNLYKKLGGNKITLSSDAHVLNHYMKDFSHYKKLLKELGFNKLSYFIKRKEYKYEI